MKRVGSIGALLLVACGPVRSADDRGDPIFTFSAVLQGEALPEPEGELRAVFGWLSHGGGEWVECAAANDSLVNCGFPRVDTYETKLSIFNVSVEARFPDGFDIHFYDFPKKRDLLDYNGAVFAMGGMAIYDDRNGNGELDPVSAMDPEPIDRLVAESIVTNLRTIALFQEGTTIHPIKKGIDVLLNCPRAPRGYSIGTYQLGPGCTIDEETKLLVTRSDPTEVGRARCGGGIAGLGLRPNGLNERPPTAIPDNAVIECQPGNSIHVWLDNGTFCDRYRVSSYALVSGPAVAPSDAWDLREDPPDYWPCAVEP